MSAEQRKRPARSEETRQPSVCEVLAARAAADAVSTPPDREQTPANRTPADATADPTPAGPAEGRAAGAPSRVMPEAPPQRRAA